MSAHNSLHFEYAAAATTHTHTQVLSCEFKAALLIAIKMNFAQHAFLCCSTPLIIY